MTRRIAAIFAFVLIGARTSLAAGPLAPAEALAAFQLEPGLRIELAAAEPDVVDPVAIAFDERGRMYVVENRGYPEGPGEGKPPAGVVALLEDADGDGRFEKRTVFADGFDFPNGVMPWKGGVFVTCSPNLWYLKDTDGDGKADVRMIALTGFSLGGSTQLRVSHPTLGIDNWIYMTNGYAGGEIYSPDQPEIAKVGMNGHDIRWNPLTGALATSAGQAQFGLTFDDFGQKFICSNRKHIEHAVIEPGDLARNPALGLSDTVAEIPDHGEAAQVFAISEARTTALAHAGTFTAACGVCIYRGTALPPEYRGNAFVCEPTGNLIHRDVLVPSGATFIAKRARQGSEFLATADTWCRPVFLANGPDGALYVCDMYRKTIEHPTYLPPEVAKRTDFSAGRDRGRIYRIKSANQPRQPSKELSGGDIPALTSALDDANGWTRDTAQRLLLEAGDDSTEALLHAALRKGDSPVARAKVLHLLAAFGSLDDPDLRHATKDASPRVLEQAIRLARIRPDGYSLLKSRAKDLASNDDARVRFALALALSDSREDWTLKPLANILARDFSDPWAREAVLSSPLAGRIAFAERFIAALPPRGLDSTALPITLESIGRMIGRAAPADESLRFLQAVFSKTASDHFLSRASALEGVAEGIRHNEAFAASTKSPLERLTQSKPDEFPAADFRRLQGETDAIVNKALEIIHDPTRPESEREAAIALLGECDFNLAQPVLTALLAPQASNELQLAAVRALGRIDDDRIGPVLCDKDTWHSYRPATRGAALAALLGRPSGVNALLTALERGDVQPWSIDPGSRSQLQNHSDAILRARAHSVFKANEATDRKKVYEEYLPVLALPSDPKSGHEVFRKNCIQCHSFLGEGHDVGPDLSDIRSHPPESILLHLLIPNQLLVTGYENYVVETSKGETISGIIKSENESSVTIRRALGEENVVPRAEIKSIYCTNLSLMPEELEKGMTKQEIRDLIGFLKGDTGKE